MEPGAAAEKIYKDRLLEERRSQPKSSVYTEEFRRDAENVRNGNMAVGMAEMDAFRLMRATGSFLSNTSHIGAEGDKSARCGLRIGFDTSEQKGYGEYIVGGWCIGSVMDSAASRAMGHNSVHTNPTSMAYNVNVNIEWWDSDRLHDAYCDEDRGNYQNDTLVPEKTTSSRGDDRAPNPPRGDSTYWTQYEDPSARVKGPSPIGANTDPAGLLRFYADGGCDTGGGATVNFKGSKEEREQAYLEVTNGDAGNEYEALRFNSWKHKGAIDKRIWRKALG
jgi:hypothetical protein